VPTSRGTRLAVIVRVQRAIVRRQHRDIPTEQTDRLPPGLQLRGPHVAFLGVLLLVADPQPPGLGAGAGPGDESAEGQGCAVERSLGAPKKR
jgi:hypothetical protein